MLKKGVLLLVVVILLGVVLVADIAASEVERMTDEQLFAIARQESHFHDIPDFHMPELFGVPLEQWDEENYENERWLVATLDSATTREEAIEEIERFINSRENTDSYTIEFVGENKFYFTFRLQYTWTQRWYPFDSITRTQRVLILNDNIKNNYFRQRYFRTLDKDTIATVLDIETYLFCIGHDRVFHRQIEETRTQFIYTYYTVIGSGAVWDTITLARSQIRINKATGEFSYWPTRGWLSPYHRVLRKVMNTGDPHFIPAPVEPLSAGMERRIKEDWLAQKDIYNEFTIDDIGIKHYNTYSNGVVLMIGPPFFSSVLTAFETNILGNYAFHFPHTGGIHFFFYSTETSTFMNYTVAYDKGLFLQEDLRDLAWRWHHRHELRVGE